MVEKSPTKFAMDGAKEIDAMLKKLPLKMQAKILKSINREGAKITLQEMKANTPLGDDRLHDSIKIRSDKENITAVTVGPSLKAFWARFLEYGTFKTPQRQTDKGHNRGGITARPFIRKSIDNTIGKVVEHITGNYAQLVDKYLQKEVKKINRIKK